MEHKKYLERLKRIIKSYRRPSDYYFNNTTNKEYWNGAKQGWRSCIDYIDAGDLDEEFEKLIDKIKKDSSKSSNKKETKKV